MAIYVYVTDPSLMDDENYQRLGALVSWCHNDKDQVADDKTLKIRGLSIISGLPELDSTHVWDEATHTVVEVAAPVIPRPISTGKWILRFTSDEYAAIDASKDKDVRHFLFALNHTTEVDLADPVIVQAVDYLATLNLITADRVAPLLASDAT